MKAQESKLSSLLPIIAMAIPAIAPFLAGTREVVGTGTVCIMLLLSTLLALWVGSLRVNRSFFPFAVFLALGISGMLITASMHATIYTLGFFTASLCSGIMAYSTIQDGRKFQWALLTVCAGAFMMALVGIQEYLRSNRDWRVFATFESPGYLGGYLVLIVPVVLGLLISAKRIGPRIALAFGWASVIVTLTLTGTRFAIASAVLSCVVLVGAMIWLKLLSRRRFIVLSVAAIIALAGGVIGSAPTWERVQGKTAVEQEHSGPFRVATWKGAVVTIKHHPLLGTGAGTFELVFPKYMVAGYTRNAHNGYLQVASDMGFPAMVALAIGFMMLVGVGVKGLKDRSSDGLEWLDSDSVKLLRCAVLAALVGSVVRNLLDSDIYNPGIAIVFWAYAGMLAGQSSVKGLVISRNAVKAVVSLFLIALSGFVYAAVLGNMRLDESKGYVEGGDIENALVSIRSATEIDPLAGSLWLMRGQLEVATSGDDTAAFEEGVAHIRRAARLEPTRSKNYVMLGRILAERGRTAEAVTAFRKAIELDPHATPAMVEAAKLLKGRDADDMYSRLLREERSPVETLKGAPELVNPDFAWGHYYFGQKAEAAGEWTRATGHYKAVVDRLEKRKSYTLYMEVAKASGMSNPYEESLLDTLLADSKTAITRVQEHSKRK